MQQSHTTVCATSVAVTTSPARPVTMAAYPNNGQGVPSDRGQAPHTTSSPKGMKRKWSKEASEIAQTSKATITSAAKATSARGGENEVAVILPSKKQKKESLLMGLEEGDENDSAVKDEASAVEPAVTAFKNKKKKPLKKLLRAQDAKKSSPASDVTTKEFLEAIPFIDSWTSSNIKDGPCKIIKWLDKDGLSVEKVVDLYHAMGHGNQDPKKPTGNPKTNIYKVYNRWAPDFYKEHGIVFVTLQVRKKYLETQEKMAEKSIIKKSKTSRPEVKKEMTLASKSQAKVLMKSKAAHSKSEPARSAQRNEGMPALPVSHLAPVAEGSVKEPYISTLDDELRDLFEQKVNAGHDASPLRRKNLRMSPTAVRAANNEASKEDIARFFANLNSQDLLSFSRKPADMPYGDPARPVLDRQAAAQYSEFLREQLSHEPDLEMIEYTDSVRPATIFRFISCISPTLRTDLPTHDLVEVDEDGERSLLQTPIGWSMIELQELYLFALQLKCEDVCDMILDRLHEEFRRSAPRTVVDVEFGEETEFNILDISPEFLNILAVSDSSGLDFFTSLLVLKKDGQNVLESLGMENWSDTIKLQLKGKLQIPSLIVLDTMHADEFCQQFHHHNYGARQHECYKLHAIAATSIAAPDVGESIIGYSTMKRIITKPDLKPSQKALFRGTEDRKKRRRNASGADIADEEERAEKRHKHEHRLEAVADREAAAKSITLDPLPNLAFPAVFHKPVHTLEEQKEKVVPFLYTEELGNGPNDKETAKKKQNLVWAKLEDFTKARGVKTVEALDELFGLMKGGKHAPRTSNGDAGDSGDEDHMEDDDE